MKIQGIIKGNTIELLYQTLDKILLPDGVEISRTYALTGNTK